MLSTGTKIKKLESLLDTEDITAWEDGFIRNIVKRTRQGAQVEFLTDSQLEVIFDIHKKHFAED